MWPFKKKEKANEPLGVSANTVLCIPGLWRDTDEIKKLIYGSSKGEWVVAGDIILNIRAKRQYKFEVSGRDDKMAGSFSHAGKETGITEDFLKRIEQHRFVVYISGKMGTMEDAWQIALAGAQLLKAGGFGIKVDSAGKAFEKNKWLNFLKAYDEVELFEMFVSNTATDKNGSAFSCGMHNLGLRDAIVSGLDFQNAVDLIFMFGFYQVFDKPVISDGQIFQADAQSPQYLITDEPEQPYKDDFLLGNPFGMWNLATLDK